MGWQPPVADQQQPFVAEPSIQGALLRTALVEGALEQGSLQGPQHREVQADSGSTHLLMGKPPLRLGQNWTWRLILVPFKLQPGWIIPMHDPTGSGTAPTDEDLWQHVSWRGRDMKGVSVCS